MKRILYSLLIAAVILPGATAHLQARDRKPKTSKTVQAELFRPPNRSAMSS